MSIEPYAQQRALCAIRLLDEQGPSVLPPRGSANKKANPEGLAFLLGDAGSPTWARTRDLRINSPALYRLSYRGITLFAASLRSTRCNLLFLGETPSSETWLPDLGSNQGPDRKSVV